jgi:hypothetical protein
MLIGLPQQVEAVAGGAVVDALIARVIDVECPADAAAALNRVDAHSAKGFKAPKNYQWGFLGKILYKTQMNKTFQIMNVLII